MRLWAFQLAPFLLAGSYLAVAVLMSPSLTRLPPDGFYNAVLARNIARGDGYLVHVIQYYAGGYDSIARMPEMHGILQPLLLAGLFRVFGPIQWLVAVPGLVMVALTSILAFFFGRRLFGVGAGLLASLLVLSSPQLTRTSYYGLDDAGFACAFLLSIMLLERALSERRTRLFLLAGLAGAVATLQKATGVVLPIAFTLVLLTQRHDSFRLRLRWGSCLILPIVAAVSPYLIRNWIGHGGLAFRWGAIDWLFKSRGLPSFLAVYDSPPQLLATLQELGAGEVVRIMLGQLESFVLAAFRITPLLRFDHDALTTPGLIFGAGALALLLHAKWAPRFALLAFVSAAVTVGLVCLVWHFEIRFFSGLIVLACISFSGLLAMGARPSSRPILRAVSISASLASAALAFTILVGDGGVFPEDQGRSQRLGPCADALGWVEQNTDPTQSFMSPWPAWWAWHADRPSLSIPSGGRDAIDRVARIYEPDFFVVEPHILRGPEYQQHQNLAEDASFWLAGELRFDGRNCDIYRVSLTP